MGDKRFLRVVLTLFVLFGCAAAAGQPPGLPPKTKLCGNEDCTEVLFEGTIRRAQDGTHTEFLHYPNVGAAIKVYAIKFSDRTDLWEGGIDGESEVKSRGFFYLQHINFDSYLTFLRNAVKQNKTMFVHSQIAQLKYKSLLGTKQAIPELIKDLEVAEKRYALENNLPEPPPLDLAALGYKVDHGHSHGGHGHSHGGHGHSHGGHDHSHEDHHGHSHEHGHDHGHSHDAPASEPKPNVEQNALRRNMQQQQAASNTPPNPASVPEPTPVVVNPPPTLAPSQIPTPTEAPQTVESVPPPSNPADSQPAVTKDVHQVKPIEATATEPNASQPAATKDVNEVKAVEATATEPNTSQSADTSQQPVESQASALPVTDSSIAGLAADSQPAADNTSQPPSETATEKIPTTTPAPVEVIEVPTVNLIQTTTPLPDVVTTQSILQRAAEAANNYASEANQLKIELAVDPTANLMPAPFNLPDELFADIANDSIFEQNANPGPATVDPVLFAAESDVDRVASVAEQVAQQSEQQPPENSIVPPASDAAASEPASPPIIPLELPPLGNDASGGVAPSPSSAPDAPSASASADVVHFETTTPAPLHLVDPIPLDEPATMPPPDPSPITPPEHTHVRDEDGQAYCIKGDCDRKIVDEPPTDEWSPPPFESLPSSYENLPPPVGVPIDGHESNSSRNLLKSIGAVIKRVVGVVRVILPSALDSIDDAGVIILLFLPIVFLNRLICGCLSNDPRLAAIDRRRFVDVCTEKKALEIENKKLSEALKHGGNNSQALADSERSRLHTEAQLTQMVKQMEGLHNRNGDLEGECDKLKDEQNGLRERAEDERQRAAEVAGRCKELERRSEMLDAQVAEYRTTCEEARDKAERFYDELQQKTSSLAEVEARERQLRLELSEVRADLKTTEEEIRQLRARNETLEAESVQLTEMIEELNNRPAVAQATNEPNGDSGGSGGWSDIGDFDAPDHGKIDSSRKRSASPGEIIDAARLRAQVKKLESDLEQTRLSLQKDADSRAHMQSKLTTVQEELTKRQTQLDQKEQERLETHAQCKRLFTMIEEKDAKIRAREEAAEKLRDTLDKLQDDLRHVHEHKKLSEERLKDMEQEVKRIRRENEKLETRHFHELKEIKTHNMQLQKVNTELITAAKSSAVLDSLRSADLNLSNNSSDPEVGNINSSLDPYGAPPLPFHRVAPPSASVPPLWSHIAASDEYPDSPPSPTELMPPKRTRTKSKGRSTPPNEQSKKSTRSRKSHRERSASPVGESHSERERRRRSRSRGRLAYPPPPGYGPYPTGFYDDPYYRPPPSSRTQHSGSSAGYFLYSSPGSAGGPSPPPEMPLLSGVPPPGITKKPAVTSGRPKNAHQDNAVSSRAT